MACDRGFQSSPTSATSACSPGRIMGTKDERLRRRTFLCGGVSASIAGVAISCAGGRSSSPWRFFTAAEGAAVEAICAQLIPADCDPGARETGVANYIDIQLTRPFRRHQAAYRQGLAKVESVSRSKFGKGFGDLAPVQQVETLNAIEEESGEFFALILTHARQGFYGDPRHGGNRHMASWKMVGLPFPPVRGRQHYDEEKAG